MMDSFGLEEITKTKEEAWTYKEGEIKILIKVREMEDLEGIKDLKGTEQIRKASGTIQTIWIKIYRAIIEASHLML